MKITRQQEGPFHLSLNQDEWATLMDLLTQYPRTPSHHHRLQPDGKGDPALKESEQWLKESIANHQTERTRQLKEWVQHLEPEMSEDGEAFQLTFDADRAEWLVEILNDIRVGCWLALDCPSPEDLTGKRWKSEDVPNLWSMEISGIYQSVLLKALS